MLFFGLVILSFILGFAYNFVLGFIVFIAGLFVLIRFPTFGKKSKEIHQENRDEAISRGKPRGIGPIPQNTSRQATGNHQKIKFDFLILGTDEKMLVNKWYQKKTARNKNFVKYRGNWSSDWKYASEFGENSAKVAGISRENRTTDFLKLAQSNDFKMYLENDPANPVNKNARKVMVSAMVDDELVKKHIGYLPDEIANGYAGVELDISPKSVFLPENENLSVGVEVTLLQRSARYLKRKAKEDANI